MTTELWRARALQMKAAGASAIEIAAAVGKTRFQIHWLLMSPEQHEHRRRRRRGETVVGDKAFVKQHGRRVSKKVAVDTMSVARRFAAGEIDRAQLSRELRGEA